MSEQPQPGPSSDSMIGFTDAVEPNTEYCQPPEEYVVDCGDGSKRALVDAGNEVLLTNTVTPGSFDQLATAELDDEGGFHIETDADGNEKIHVEGEPSDNWLNKPYGELEELSLGIHRVRTNLTELSQETPDDQQELPDMPTWMKDNVHPLFSKIPAGITIGQAERQLRERMDAQQESRTKLGATVDRLDKDARTEKIISRDVIDAEDDLVSSLRLVADGATSINRICQSIDEQPIVLSELSTRLENLRGALDYSAHMGDAILEAFGGGDAEARARQIADVLDFVIETTPKMLKAGGELSEVMRRVTDKAAAVGEGAIASRKLKQGVLDVVSEIVQQFRDSPPAGEGRPGENQGTSSEQPLEDLAKAYGADKNSADEDRETNGLVTGIEDKAKGFISRLNGEDQDPKDKPFAEDLISSLRAYAGSYDDDSSIRAQRGIASALESILYVREATDSIDKIRKIFEEVKQFVEPASESLQADRHKREGSLAQRQTLTKIFTDAL